MTQVLKKKFLFAVVDQGIFFGSPPDSTFSPPPLYKTNEEFYANSEWIQVFAMNPIQK